MSGKPTTWQNVNEILKVDFLNLIKCLIWRCYFEHRTICRGRAVKLEVLNEPLARYVKLRVAHAPGMPGTFSPPMGVSDPDMHHGTCVMHVPWCMPGSLTSGFLWSRWRGKRSRHSRRKRNPQFCVSGKRPIGPFLNDTGTELKTFISIYLYDIVNTSSADVMVAPGAISHGIDLIWSE